MFFAQDFFIAKPEQSRNIATNHFSLCIYKHNLYLRMSIS